MGKPTYHTVNNIIFFFFDKEIIIRKYSQFYYKIEMHIKVGFTESIHSLNRNSVI